MTKLGRLIESLNGILIPDHPSKETRLLFLVASLGIGAIVAHVVAGSVFPSEPEKSLVFQVFFFMFVFGMFFLEDKFTKPVDAIVNASATLVSVAPVYAASNDSGWIPIMFYASAVFLVGTVNILVSNEDRLSDRRTAISKVTFECSKLFGKSNIIFSVAFIYAVIVSFGTAGLETWVLILFWGVYLALFPLKVPHLLEAIWKVLSRREESLQKIGRIARVDNPNIVRVSLREAGDWSGSVVATIGDGKSQKILPLYTHLEDTGLIGTGLAIGTYDVGDERTFSGTVYRRANATKDTMPVGIIHESSSIGSICFETWASHRLSEGDLVYCKLYGETVFYQVSDAHTWEESFQKHKHGLQLVSAQQLGTIDSKSGFKKYHWLPEMNQPVYVATEDTDIEQSKPEENEMVLGTIPGSNVNIVCNLEDMLTHHTAILGVTGTGKTELAYRLIKSCVALDCFVICIDITGDYGRRLSELKPMELSIRNEKEVQLSELQFALETRQSGAAKNLKEFREKFVTHIDEKIATFLGGNDRIALFTMPSMSNTKSTIYTTEVYLSRIFEYNRTKKGKRKRILIVLEEAHTVIPEAVTMGVNDWDSKAIIANISQIALQGRKYGVGLLVIAQRTATVSKTVLTQCNTVIAFGSFDETGLNFFSNIFGREHTRRIPNLGHLEALVFGKGIKSERPVVVRIPFDEKIPKQN